MCIIPDVGSRASPDAARINTADREACYAGLQNTCSCRKPTYVIQMRNILFIAAAVVAIAVLAMLVWNAPKRPGADPTEPTAAQTE
ncbi:hypothetical protein GCM10010869_72400 [Mesorhizobium tianshanense]|nr:hypothetical protein GCM10010869_72400 [Mesorhizobium tianshanense]